MSSSQSAGMEPKRNSIESMSKDELINKHKTLLSIAKQAKKAKDEFAEENQKLKEQLTNCETQRDADKKSLLTMKEMLEEFTRNKLELASETSELREQNKILIEERASLKNDVEILSIENEALRRQLDRLTEDNESLLTDIDNMEQQLKQVNVLGMEQKKHLDLLELEVEKLKEYEVSSKNQETEIHKLIEANASLQKCYETSQTESQSFAMKYQSLKQINSDQRAQFNGLKERSIEIYRKLKQLQECKRILVESHHEYADSISRWQLEIMHASDQLCNHIRSLTNENTELKSKIQTVNRDVSITLPRLPVLIEYCEQALIEYRRQNEVIAELMSENEKLRKQVDTSTQATNEDTKIIADEQIELLRTENVRFKEEAPRTSASDEAKLSFKEVEQLRIEIAMLEEQAANTKLATAKELDRLRLENTRLEQETIKIQVNAIEIDRLRKSNQGLQDKLLTISSASNVVDDLFVAHLPNLIDCCDRALLEHRQQTALLEELRRDNHIEEQGQKQINDSHKELYILKNENDKLKAELSKAKQAEAEVKDLLKLRDDLLATTQLCEDLQTKLEKQERENTDLLNEMRELNEALKGRGDVISRQQEKHQELVAEIKKTSNALTKIEADLSGKDTIIKEKEFKLAKMSEDNNSALQEVNRLQNVSRENELRIKTLSEEIAAMRIQLENHETQSEILSTSTISRAEDLARLREVDESFEEKYNKLRSLAMKLKKKAHEQSLCIADLEKQSVDSKTKATEATEKITSLELERESLQKELKTCKSQMETLKIEVDKLKASKKQSNVLNLEIEAFEKSLNETSAKLTAKTAELELMRETLQSKESAIEVMKKEIQILEDSQENEKVHSVELKKQIDKLQAQLKDVIHSKQEVSAKLDESQSEKQTLQLNLDEINQRLASIADERDAQQAVLLAEKENLLQTINSLEDELNASNSRIIISERSFQDLNQEYSNYKVKAQSVLRQNQTKESSKERELEEELTLLKDEHKNLSNRFQIFIEKLQTSEKSNEELQEENRCLQNRNAELINTISAIRQQTDILSHENKKQLETYQETLKAHRLQIEALGSCHLEQMQDLQTQYDREIAELKAIKKKDVESVAQNGKMEKLDYFLLEREDAEGSEAEAAHTPKYLPSAKRSTHDSVPLDELLSSPTVDSTYTLLERRRSISPSVELQETKERLHKQESRVRHLTSLLAESEQDLARLTQLNEMLKEEVRRQERTVEREKHMHNSEYLKNVVLKFVCLNNVDERTRLVPVLNTILKLSPSETEMLQNVAKGKDNNNRSWGSFLPHWGTS